MVGLSVLFGLAYGLVTAGTVAGVLWSMNRPRRKTMGVSLAMGGPGDPADLGLDGREVMFNLSDGSASPGWIVRGDRPGSAEEFAAVVVHGHRDSRFGSLFRAKMLTPFVSASAVFDLPGHGDAAAAGCLMGGREAADVAAVVSGLPPELVDRPVVLLGYSMGATVVLKAAAQEPALRGRVAGVVACAPYRFWDQGLRGQLRRRRLPAWPTVMLVGVLLRLAGVYGRGLGERPGFDRAADAAALGCPLLVLHGDADEVCPLEAGRQIAEAATDGELVVIGGGTHNKLLETDPGAVHAALARFFAKLNGADPGRAGGGAAASALGEG